jgi:hypothetical protein
MNKICELDLLKESEKIYLNRKLHAMEYDKEIKTEC